MGQKIYTKTKRRSVLRAYLADAFMLAQKANVLTPDAWRTIARNGPPLTLHKPPSNPQIARGLAGFI